MHPIQRTRWMPCYLMSIFLLILLSVKIEAQYPELKRLTFRSVDDVVQASITEERELQKKKRKQPLIKPRAITPPKKAKKKPPQKKNKKKKSPPSKKKKSPPKKYPPKKKKSKKSTKKTTKSSDTVPTKQPSRQPTSAPSSYPTKSPTQQPTAEPSLLPSQSPSHDPSKPPPGYFTYDQGPDAVFGPGTRVDDIIVENKKTVNITDDNVTVWGFTNNYWENVSAVDTLEAKYYKEFEDRIPFRLDKNFCGVVNGGRMQSPIDVWPTTNATCFEHHEIRDKPGDFNVDDIEVEKQILPSKLRLLYPRRTGPEPDVPSADIPFGWGKQLDVIHIDMKFPSEHTLKGKRYPGEYQVYIMAESGRGAAVVSIFMDIDPVRELGNRYFQRAIDEFQLQYDSDLSACNETRKRNFLPGLNKDDLLKYVLSESNKTLYREEDDILLNAMTEERFVGPKRNLQIKEGYNSSDPLTAPGRWDPWHHKHIMKSIWFYGYRGTLTEPPCTPFLEWRIIDTPMVLSKSQFVQLKSILFNHVDDKCVPTSVHSNSSVARPLQQNITGDVHRCTCHHFVSDELKREGIHRCHKRFNYTIGIDMV